MAFIFCDGCDTYSSNSDIGIKWGTAAGFSYSSGPGKFGVGGCIQTGGGSTLTKPGVTTPSGATFYMGHYVRCTVPGAYYSLFQINGQTILGVDATGHIVLVNNNSTPLATATQPIGSASQTIWHWVEFSVTLNGNSSTAALYVDGVSQWSGTYALSAFAAQAITSVCWAFGSNLYGYLDDLILWDSTGSAFNTFPLGPRRIATLNPNAAGASTQFTPSSGANYACVNQGWTGSAYVADGGSGNTDLYGTNTLGYTPGSTAVNAVAVTTYAYNPAGDSTKSYAAKLRSGSTPTVASGPTRTAASGLTMYQDIFYTDGTGAAWTTTTANALQPGVGD